MYAVVLMAAWQKPMSHTGALDRRPGMCRASHHVDGASVDRLHLRRESSGQRIRACVSPCKDTRVGGSFQVLKDWEVGLGIVGDMFFSILPKIKD